MWDPDDAFAAAAADYARAHHGRDAMAEALPWARKLLDWYHAYLITADLPPSSVRAGVRDLELTVVADPAARRRVELLLAERIRIHMYERRCAIGDVNLMMVGGPLAWWRQPPAHYPEPPDSPTAWPAPAGSLGEELRAVHALYNSDEHDHLWRPLVLVAYNVFKQHRAAVIADLGVDQRTHLIVDIPLATRAAAIGI